MSTLEPLKKLRDHHEHMHLHVNRLCNCCMDYTVHDSDYTLNVCHALCPLCVAFVHSRFGARCHLNRENIFEILEHLGMFDLRCREVPGMGGWHSPKQCGHTRGSYGNC